MPLSTISLLGVLLTDFFEPPKHRTANLISSDTSEQNDC